jgi:hypothetical protein
MAMTHTEMSPARILELGSAFWASKTLLSAVELGLFATLARNGPLDAEALRRRLGLHVRGAHDFFDALVALGMLERDRENRYANTPETALYLDPRQEAYVGGLLEMFNARLFRFWGSLTEALRTGQPQNEAKDGGDLFPALYGDPVRLEIFLRAMTGLSLPIARVIAERFPWNRYRTFVDIGTAQGCLPVQIAMAHPHLKGAGFDLLPVQPIFEAYVQEHGLGDRLSFHAGDFLRDGLPGADVLIMGHILHDWDVETKKALVASAFSALPPGGSLLVYDMMIDDERRHNAAGLLMSLNMLIETRGGFDYTGADCVGWMREAGFREARAEALADGHAMATGMK